MKRILLPLIILMSLVNHSFAQCETPLQKVIEDFNTQPDPNNLAVLPDCWQAVYTAPYQGREVGSVQIYNGKLIINSTYGGIAFTPKVQNSQGTITFKARKGYSGGMSLEMGFYSGGTFYLAQSFVLSGTQQTHSYDFSNYSGYSNDYIAFRHAGTNGSAVNIEIDDVVYKSFCQPEEPPVAIAKDITVKLDATGNVIVNPSQVNNGSTDDCGEFVTDFSLDKTLFTCDDLGANEVTLTATDSEGQTATATATITVEPGISISASYFYLPESGEELLDLDILLSTTTTRCDAISYSISQSSITCEDLGSLLVTVTATYDAGTTTYDRNFYVIDAIAPVVLTQNINVTIDDESGEAQITPEMIDNGSTDNCSIASMSLSQSTFICNDQGENEVTLTVTDASGNHSTGTAMVTVGSFVQEIEVTSDATTVCFGDSESSEGATISTVTSEPGVNYFLRKSSDSSVVDGPIAGTGEGLSFSTGAVSENTTFQVYAEVPFSGNALSLPGSSEYLAVNTPNNFDYSTGYTISAWINEPAGGNSTMYNTLFYAGGAAGSDIEVYQNSSSGVFTILHNRDNGGTISHYSVSTNFLPDAEWVHFAVTYDGATSRIYVNGELRTTNALLAPVKSASSEMTFGYLNSNAFPAAQVFDGMFDDIRIYNEARTADQLSKDMRTCQSGSDESLLLHYDMESASGSILTDLINNTPAQIKNQNSGGIVADGAISCTYTCSRVMTTEVTIGDDVAPTISVRNITLNLPVSGTAEITPTMIDNGSTDNCSVDSVLVLTLDQTYFDCNSIGENIVTFTVTDEAGNSASEEVTVTVVPLINDESVTALATDFCPGEIDGTTISVANTKEGIDYLLRKSSDNSVIDGPIKGTGEALDFNTGEITETTTFNVFATNAREPGTALDFDGINDFVNAGTDNRGITTKVTLSAWVKTSRSGSNNLIVSKYNGANGFLMYVNVDGFARIDGRDGSGGYKSSGTSTTAVNDNLWHHIAATINTTTGEWKIYVDGMLESATTNTTGGAMSPIKAMTIGSLDNSYFLGQIDQVLVWNEALGDSLIAANSNACTAMDTSGVVAYFDFNEGSATTATDLSANGLDAALTNMDQTTDWVAQTPEATCVFCELQMSTEITVFVGDTLAPTVITRDISLVLGESGNAAITAEAIDNGSEDNCTSSENLSFSLDVVSFDIEDLGENTVTLTVEDQNGNIASATATVTVSDKEAQTITVAGIEDKTFGDADFTISATLDSELPVTFSVLSGDIEITSTNDGSATIKITGAGSASIRMSNEGDDTYAPLQFDAAFVIAKADQVIEVAEVPTQSTLTATVTIEASVNTGLDLSYAVAGPASINENVVTLNGTIGTVAVTVTQVGNDDYNAISEIINFEVVEKDSQTITFADISDEVTYGDAGISLSASSTSSLGVSFAVVSGNATLNGDVLNFVGVGSVVIAAIQEGNDLFLAADSVKQTIVVNPKTLTATADSKAISFGDAIPSLTITYSGFVNEEGVSVLTSEPVASTTATATSDTGNFAIDMSGGAAENYVFNLVPGTLTINQAMATVSISDLEHVKDGSAKEATVTTDPAGLNFTITYDGSSGAPSAVGSYQVEVVIDEINYTGGASATLMINNILGESQTRILVYPNPTSESFEVSGTEGLMVEVYDLTGQLKLEAISNQEIDVSNLSAGAYLVKVGTAGIFKLIKK
ncbi:MAG: LamG-like jellyroll fold domain-containing protein [Marinoscillum sp.]